MRIPGRAAAAIEILKDIFEHHRPASEALKDWGKSHRFAGSTDRHAIGTLVYDCLRKRNSLAARMGDGRPRALVLGALRDVWNVPLDHIEALGTDAHGPGVLTEAEKTALARTQRNDLPPHVKGDIPEWLLPSFVAAFGGRAAEEGAALAMRAPIDLRVNTLKATREQVLEALQKFGAVPGPLSPHAVRIPAPGHDTRNANVEAEPAHGRGWYEVQDAASQAAAEMSGAKPGEFVVDLCAGAGGKTLALAAMMQNKGKLIAHDQDRHRLRPIFERLTRAGVENVEVIAAEDGDKLVAMGGFDCVFIDAPCSGSGAWRRKPDAKWRLTQKQLQQRITDQRDVMERGAKLVKVGGRMVYVTCSVLPEENEAQVAVFLDRHKEFKSGETRLLTPAQHKTDGFFIAVLRKA